MYVILFLIYLHASLPHLADYYHFFFHFFVFFCLFVCLFLSFLFFILLLFYYRKPFGSRLTIYDWNVSVDVLFHTVNYFVREGDTLLPPPLSISPPSEEKKYQWFFPKKSIRLELNFWRQLAGDKELMFKNRWSVLFSVIHFLAVFIMTLIHLHKRIYTFLWW